MPSNIYVLNVEKTGRTHCLVSGSVSGKKLQTETKDGGHSGALTIPDRFRMPHGRLPTSQRATVAEVRRSRPLDRESIWWCDLFERSHLLLVQLSSSHCMAFSMPKADVIDYSQD